MNICYNKEDCSGAYGRVNTVVWWRAEGHKLEHWNITDLINVSWLLLQDPDKEAAKRKKRKRDFEKRKRKKIRQEKAAKKQIKHITTPWKTIEAQCVLCK